jgi:hypothetical protein
MHERRLLPYTDALTGLALTHESLFDGPARSSYMSHFMASIIVALTEEHFGVWRKLWKLEKEEVDFVMITPSSMVGPAEGDDSRALTIFFQVEMSDIASHSIDL